MTSLAGVLKKQMPIDRLVATCDECGEVFFDSKTDSHRRGEGILTARTIEIQARAHRAKSGHDDLDVTIDKPEPVEEIEATITVDTT